MLKTGIVEYLQDDSGIMGIPIFPGVGSALLLLVPKGLVGQRVAYLEPVAKALGVEEDDLLWSGPALLVDAADHYAMMVTGVRVDGVWLDPVECWEHHVIGDPSNRSLEDRIRIAQWAAFKRLVKMDAPEGCDNPDAFGLGAFVGVEFIHGSDGIANDPAFEAGRLEGVRIVGKELERVRVSSLADGSSGEPDDDGAEWRGEIAGHGHT
jgi:hypothetical protein